MSKLSFFWEGTTGNLKKEKLSLSADQYTVIPDSKPIIGPHPEIPGLDLNTGYSGHGIMGSHDCGRLAVDLIIGRVSEAENPFSCKRFI